MLYGAHLPVADLGQGVSGAGDLRRYAAAAAALGFATLSANDHLVWRRPWLDGPATLLSVLEHTGDMTLATSVALPAVRHPVVLAKTLSTLAVLADRPVIAGLGPGSSAADYDAVGVPFEERWSRFDEAFAVTRGLLRGEPVAPGTFTASTELRLDPLPRPAPQVWFGSWGSDQRLRRLAAAADGWMASAYNTTPDRFADARSRLDAHLRAAGRDPAGYPDLVATMWLYVTDDTATADRLLVDVLAPLLGRDAEQLRRALPIGPADHCVHLLSAYATAGAQQVLVWPVRDPIDQLERFAARIRPYVDT